MEKIWYKNYDPGVPHTIDPDQYSSLIHVLEDSFTRCANRPALINFGVPLTYGNLDKYSQAFAGYLQHECGVVKGDRVAIFMPNLLQYAIAICGILRTGATVININPLCDYKEVNLILKDLQPKCVLVYTGLANVLEPALVDIRIKHIIYTEIGDMFPFFKRLLFSFVVKHVKKMVPKWYIPGAVSFLKTIEHKYIPLFKKVHIDSTDVAFLQFSEGRASDTKNCIMLTHRNIIANVLQMAYWIDSFFRNKNVGPTVNPFPFCKTISMTQTFIFFRVGFAIDLITDPRNISSFVKELKKQPFSFFFGINSLFNALMMNDEFRQIDFSPLKYSVSGGVMTQVSTAEKWSALTGTNILQCYGLVEASPIVTATALSSKKFRTSVGLPLPSTDVKVCDENGRELGIDMIGELWVKGPQVMKGYWNDPEKTKTVLMDDGWLKTGDIVKIDSDGFLYLVARKEDIMLINDHQVYPIEVEAVIATVPGVLDVAVVGIVDSNEKQYIKACIVRLDDSVTENAVLETCQKMLKDYQVPSKIEFYATLPKTAVGYTIRRLLRSEDNQGRIKKYE